MLIRSAIAGSIVTLLMLACAPEGRAQMYEGRELVKAELSADTNAVVPGKPFTVGLLLKMAPGWHTYWKFPGDAALPTEIKWKLPIGWRAGEIQWPIPLKFVEAGDIHVYGYGDEMLLMQEITPPSSLQEANAQLAAEANWLVCEKICIPGSASLQVTLPVGKNGTPAHTEIFSRFRKMLPQEWPDEKIATAKWSRDGADLLLTVSSAVLAKSAAVDFYPLPDEQTVVGHPRLESRKGNDVTLRIPIDPASPQRSSMAGLVVFGEGADAPDRSAWRVPVSETVAVSPPTMNPGGSALKYLSFGFLGGLILNLMPCVLPVISLKIFGFIQHAGQSRRRIFRSGLAFSAGIFAWFIGLALLLIALKTAGHEITWAFQFTNAYFVLGLSAVVLVFALNLFGVFEISLPQGAAGGLLSWTGGEGDAGSFFQGVFATVLATPCTAPFLGTALGFAFAGSGLMILAMFVAIAAGMALPYLLLCAQPAWLRFLPKPGGWMERVKQSMGFLLLATLLFLVYVLAAQRGFEAAIWALCFFLVLSIVCWIKGAFLTPVASTRSKVVALLIISILLVTGSLYFIGDKFRASTISTNAENTDGGWINFTPERLHSELDQDRRVFIDFTAAWCLTCKFNERTVLESDAVRDAFQRHNIVKIKADWTNADPAITKMLKQFGRPGVPLYVLYPGKNGEPFVFPELLTKSMVLEKLETITRTVASY